MKEKTGKEKEVIIAQETRGERLSVGHMAFDQEVKWGLETWEFLAWSQGVFDGFQSNRGHMNF